VYLQKDDLKDRDKIPKDTVLRSHALQIREYRIQPLDMLSINFETLSEESDAFDFLSKLSPQSKSGSSVNAGAAMNGILVNVDGEVEYAVLGKIKLAGLTLFEAKDVLQAKASQFMPDVVVRIRMLNFRFTMLGEVNSEGSYNSMNTRLTMMEAIGLAGGLGELADRSLVKVVRQVADRTEVYYIDLLKEDFLESKFYYVQQNDVIIVPPLKQRTFKKYFTGNLGIITTTLSFLLFAITLTR
jgi:polysaccharide export outer membrane protein